MGIHDHPLVGALSGDFIVSHESWIEIGIVLFLLCLLVEVGFAVCSSRSFVTD